MTEFYGTLTIDNLENVANKILEKLSEKYYTFVAVYEYKVYKPETRTRQQLKDGTNKSPLSIWYFDNKKEYAGFNFCDSYGVWGCSTHAKGSEFDSTYENPYIVIEYNQITITQQTPEGRMSYWQITLEE